MQVTTTPVSTTPTTPAEAAPRVQRSMMPYQAPIEAGIESEEVDRILNKVLGPHDWLSRHPKVCLAIVAALIILQGAI